MLTAHFWPGQSATATSAVGIAEVADALFIAYSQVGIHLISAQRVDSDFRRGVIIRNPGGAVLNINVQRHFPICHLRKSRRAGGVQAERTQLRSAFQFGFYALPP